MQKRVFSLINSILFFLAAAAQPVVQKVSPMIPAAMRMELYLPLLKGKSVAVFANQTSMIGNTHLVDTLLRQGILVKKIFSPEHGFRGDADYGEQVSNSMDVATGLPIVSLYGDHKKPTAGEVADVDVLLFDIQDVGLRFYTYIGSLEYLLEGAVEYGKPLIILDRPNPNGFYVDGPLMQKGFTSFIGMQPVPVVYGMTIGEYGQMLLGEKMLAEPARSMIDSFYHTKSTAVLPGGFWLKVIPCKNYDHTMTYDLPVKPSPNLPNHQSILLYPSTCFFEGTDLSLGRGTDKPFQIYGHPSLPDTLFQFTPASVPGAKNPPQLNKTCYGYDLSGTKIDITKKENQQINLSYLMRAYREFPQKDSFFLRPPKGNPSTSDYFFNKLAGNDLLMWQIMNYKSEAEIRKSWAADIAAFKKIRKKYLLYKDFE